MLQPAVVSEAVGAVMTLPSMKPQTTVPLTLKDSAVSALTLANPTMTLHQLITSSNDQDLATNRSQCPASLGNPSSILPFLMAQASSVFSIASGKETGFLAGGIATSSTHASSDTSVRKKDWLTDSSLPVGLDLGNGWKVVGITSLADVANQTTLRPTLVTTNAKTAAPTIAGLSVACPARAASTLKLTKYSSIGNVTTSTSMTASGSSEWKVVGLTSLSSSVSGKALTLTGDSCDNGKTASAPCTKAWDFSSLEPASPAATVSDQKSCSCSSVSSYGCEKSDSTSLSGVSSDLCLPSLADLAAGTSDWKIAGITTLPVSGLVSTPVAANPVCTAPAAVPVSISCADSQQWKVVGLTSIHSSPQPPPPPVCSLSPSDIPAPITPIPVLMAPAAPLVAVPNPPTTPAMVGESGGDEEWKVVGMVPLPQSDKELTKAIDNSSPSGLEDGLQACEASETHLKSTKPAASDAWASNLLHQALDKASQQFDEKPSGSSTMVHIATSDSDSRANLKHHVSTMLTRNTHNRVWASQQQWRCQREDSSSATKSNPSHPLAFLKNCSNQFRNAVLKKNTVSTMLELKRAFENVEEEDKLVTFLGRKRVFTLSKHGSALSVFPERSLVKGKTMHHKEDGSRNLDASPCGCETVDSVLASTPRPIPSKYMQLLADSESERDDKMVLANVYRSQVNKQTRTNTAPVVFVRSNESSHSKDIHSLPDEHDAKNQVSVDSCLRVVKAENGEEVMSIRGFDCDNVNLTNVDPWGVCTDEDLDEIAEMMSDKRGNKTSHSSSRKRKLSTPRKMVQ